MSEESDLDRVIKSLQRLQVEHRRLAERERLLLERADTLRARIQQRNTSDNTEQFQTGDRVYITNRITHVGKDRTANSGDRAAVVIAIVDEQIHVRTVNGHETWRAGKNLRRLRGGDE